jgi:uncharacterized protein YndB with AHSA1/START domain/DNA-binding transcriptional ArsR family regulator
MDKIFKALSDKSRRQILDLVKNKPGINVNDLTEHFEFSRFAVMKHIKIMENADLIVSKKSGKNKLLYLNAMPIQYMYDRWISKFSKEWASSLAELKYTLEKEGEKMENDLKHIFVTYIKTTKEKLWEALTKGELTKKYYYNTEINSDLKPGSKIIYTRKNEKGDVEIPIKGKILEIEPMKKLVHTFSLQNDDKPSKVTYEIEEANDSIKLTLTHDGFDEKTVTYNSVVEGWPLIFSALKTYLETGNILKY